MLNSLGWTRDGLSISVRDSIVLRRMLGMQCHGRLKRMQKVVAASVSKEALDTLKSTRGYGDYTMCVGSTHDEIDSSLLLNVSARGVPSRGCGSIAPKATVEVDKAGIKTSVEVTEMEGIEPRVVNLIKLLIVGAASCGIITE
ncbi:hypothetical protein TIFTF001_033472 [Ficus carica]|uniref:Uncharacterized protein n=1 Tax=Ficus carica TaxID=3494 RepID=A0AA88J7N8_FICCA|nr:hypothetical protein TIFTF001_033472 [Ficus carica]